MQNKKSNYYQIFVSIMDEQYKLNTLRLLVSAIKKICFKKNKSTKCLLPIDMSKPKRFKSETTLLENLPNELFLEAFGYLNGVDVVYGFSQLNYRLEDLLNNYVTNFDFKSVSRAKFTYITQRHDIHRWRSLHMSDDDHTPGQIKCFSQLFPPNEYINRLECLSVLHMKPGFAQEFLLQIRSLNNLVSLSIGQICGLNIQSIELSSLKRLILTSCKHTNWIQNFQTLENLQYTIDYNCSHSHSLILPRTLKHFKIFYSEREDGDDLRKLLKQLPQLTRLTLYDRGKVSPIPDGRTWEELIVSSLPLLKTFQFFFPFCQYRYLSSDINQILASFSTPFYLSEKHWFIRYDRSSCDSNTGTVYSLPFAFSSMAINIHSFDMSATTLPFNDSDKIETHYYSKINTIVLHEKCKEPHTEIFSSNIVHLILKVNLPSWIDLLTNLRCLHVGWNVHMTPTECSHLLQNASNLRSLKISIFSLKIVTDKFSNETVCNELARKIESLTISNFVDGYSRRSVSVRVLTSLVRIFSMNCQHLTIALMSHPNTVYPILRRMKNLRSLHITWSVQRRNFSTPISQLLQEQSTDPKAIDFIDTYDGNQLFIWFGNRI
ncbi:unnamed protein product [Rotaria socialis]